MTKLVPPDVVREKQGAATATAESERRKRHVRPVFRPSRLRREVSRLLLSLLLLLGQALDKPRKVPEHEKLPAQLAERVWIGLSAGEQRRFQGFHTRLILVGRDEVSPVLAVEKADPVHDQPPVAMPCCGCCPCAAMSCCCICWFWNMS